MILALDPKHKNLRMARIEAHVENEPYPTEIGRIRITNNDKLFEEVRDLIENASLPHR